MIRATLTRDSCSPLYVLRCDPERCDRRHPPPPHMNAATASDRGFCQAQGCWLGSAFTPEAARGIAARMGAEITTEKLA